MAVQVSFEDDVILNQLNEYEVLQLLLGECRDRLTSYAGMCIKLPVHVWFFFFWEYGI